MDLIDRLRFYSNSVRLLTSDTSWTPIEATGLFFKNLQGDPFVYLNVDGTYTGSPSSGNITFDGITFKTGISQAVSLWHNGGAVAWTAYAAPATSVVSWAVGAGIGEISVTGIVKLNSWPSFLE